MIRLSILLLLVSASVPSLVSAATLEATTDKDSYEAGELVTITLVGTIDPFSEADVALGVIFMGHYTEVSTETAKSGACFDGQCLEFGLWAVFSGQGAVTDLGQYYAFEQIGGVTPGPFVNNFDSDSGTASLTAVFTAIASSPGVNELMLDEASYGFFGIGPGTVVGSYLVTVADLGAICSGNEDCSSGFCSDGLCCDAACGGGIDGDCQACSVATGSVADGVCTVLSAATVCRESAGNCDVSEFCDGVSPECSQDILAESDVLCRASVGVCDKDDYCNGLEAECPTDKKFGDKYDTKVAPVCREAAGLCDVEEFCDGLDDCPPDAVEKRGVVCRDSVDMCDAVEDCDGNSAVCPDDESVADGEYCGANGVCLQGECQELVSDPEPESEPEADATEPEADGAEPEADGAEPEADTEGTDTEGTGADTQSQSDVEGSDDAGTGGEAEPSTDAMEGDSGSSDTALSGEQGVEGEPEASESTEDGSSSGSSGGCQTRGGSTPVSGGLGGIFLGLLSLLVLMRERRAGAGAG